MNHYSRSSFVLLLIFFFASANHAQTKKMQIDSLLKYSARLGILNGNVLIVEQGKPFIRVHLATQMVQKRQNSPHSTVFISALLQKNSMLWRS